MKKLIPYWVVFAVGSIAYTQVKPLMDQMQIELFKLKPYIVSEVKYTDPKNHDVVDGSLKRMIELSQKMNHESMIRRSGLLVSSDVLNQQLREAEAVYNNGQSAYSLWILKSTLSVCMSCHTQGPGSSTRFSEFNKNQTLTNSFEEGEFLFVVRDFSGAMKAYDKAIKAYPSNLSAEDAEKVVLRQLFYYVRVKRDFAGLINALSEDSKNQNLPEHLSKKIKDLKVAAEKLKKEKYPAFKSSNEEELRKYAESNLKDELAGKFNFNSADRELSYLKVSSVLHQYLQNYPGTHLKPDILYWLSLSESRYSHDAFYSFPELYLKQCVLEFPKSAIAKKCLTEYQDLIAVTFTGTKGAQIPEAVSTQLKTMQELVKKVND